MENGKTARVNPIERKLYGDNVRLLERGESRAVFRLPCRDGGSGIMTAYTPFPGTYLVFSAFHAKSSYQVMERSADLLALNHCKQGRYECEFEGGLCAYLGEGDCALCTLDNRQLRSGFPLEVYTGLTLIFDVPEAQPYLTAAFPALKTDLGRIEERTCRRQCLLMHAQGGMKLLLDSFYADMPEEIRMRLYRLKILELLQYLAALPRQAAENPIPYVSRERADRMKLVRARLEQDLIGNLTLRDLAGEFDMSVSLLKDRFREVFGTSPMCYRKQRRMEKGAELLRKTGMSVGEIASRLGYENASKFSAAFCSVMGSTPARYRNHFRQTG